MYQTKTIIEDNKSYFLLMDNEGDKYWLFNSTLHRENGPAIERANGSQMWFNYGQLHRMDGPAIIYDNGNQEWYCHDLLHREDGPAIEHVSGRKEWWFKGKFVTSSSQEEFDRSLKLQALW
jgi:hypothetical protein